MFDALQNKRVTGLKSAVIKPNFKRFIAALDSVKIPTGAFQKVGCCHVG